jgi:AraC family transcriptional regulator
MADGAATQFMEMWQARRVHDYVALNLRSKIRPRDLAQVAQLSHSDFNAAFRASFGYAPSQFVIRMRIARAQRLLTGSHDSLRKVAVECAFSDPSDLKNTFQRIVGDSPVTWRARQRTASSRTVI